MKVTIYHNPRCSKSRQTLALLTEHGVTVDTVEYLKAPPDREMLKSLVDMLGVTARDIIRTGESEYKALGLDDAGLSDDTLLDAVAGNPILLQRPIVVRGNRAVIGRPPENVLTLMD